MKFELSKEQIEKLNKWLKSKSVKYEGAIGGRYEYCFAPTSLGVIIKVKDCMDKDEIDLTDYEGF